jgi:neutral ceramidase
MLKIGFARANITPPPGCNVPGGHFPRAGTHVHDDLYATAMVVDNGVETVALVGLDSLSVKRSTVQAARRLAHKLCGIKGENIMVGASHTHCGGPTCDCLGSRPEKWYCDLVGKQIAAAVSEASRLKTEAVISIGSGCEDTVAFNRRFVMNDGKETTHPGKMNPGIAEIAGPIDPEVGVIAVFAAAGVGGVTDPEQSPSVTAPTRLLGCVVNYTLHGTVGVGGTGYSADWPHYLREAISGVYGADVLTVFLNGACGDVTQVDNQSPRPREFGEDFGRYVGYTVAAEAIKVIEGLSVEGEKYEDVPLGATSELMAIPMRPVTPQVVAKANKYLKEHKGEQTGDGVSADDMLRLAEWIKTEPEVPSEIQAIRLGPLGIVSNPAEYFCCFGLDIKQASPFEQTMVVELANGCIGYVPDEKALGPKGGGYEPHHACSSKLVPEAGKLIAEKSVELLKQLA